MANHNVDNRADKSNPHRPLALTSPKQRQGSRFERQACEFLQAKGLLLVAQNWQQPKVGELDLVMIESGQAWSTLVFIEVRQRQRSCFGDAALSVTAGKQRKIIKTAKYFLQQYPEYGHYDCRFDVIAYDVAQRANSVQKGKNDKGKHDRIQYDSLNNLNVPYQQNHQIESQETATHQIENYEIENHEIESHQIKNYSINNAAVNSQPEWLIGAFIATAW